MRNNTFHVSSADVSFTSERQQLSAEFISRFKTRSVDLVMVMVTQDWNTGLKQTDHKFDALGKVRLLQPTTIVPGKYFFSCLLLNIFIFSRRGDWGEGGGGWCAPTPPWPLTLLESFKTLKNIVEVGRSRQRIVWPGHWHKSRVAHCETQLRTNN